MKTGTWMLYGATGYTGTKIAEEAIRRGHRPILAGRNAEKLRLLAERLGLQWLAFSLDDNYELRKAADSVDLILHAAGSFSSTSEPVMDACLKGQAHYLDISNEISVLQAAQFRHLKAQAKGVSIIPGIGFGTVASSCLVRHVCSQIAEPVELEIVMSPYVAQKSVGATKSTLDAIAHGGYVRRNGVLIATPFGLGAKRMCIAHANHNLLPVPSGDLEAAYMTTGIADIAVYMASPLNPALARFLLPLVQKTLSWNALRRKIGLYLDGRPAYTAHPVDANRRSWVWVRAADRKNKEVCATLEAGEGYAFTASASVQAVEQVLGSGISGAMTLASAFGADFVLNIEGVFRTA